MGRKVYIASRFMKDGHGGFRDDFRTRLLCGEGGLDGSRLRNFSEDAVIRTKGGPLHYIGPFWNEKASEGVLTSDDCASVVRAENGLIEACDLFICYFDEELSPGSITELVYACALGKEILVFYKAEDAGYEVKSPSWYPIVFAQQMGAKAIPVAGTDEVVSFVQSMGA